LPIAGFDFGFLHFGATSQLPPEKQAEQVEPNNIIRRRKKERKKKDSKQVKEY
jgi:hypothetical protein